MFGNDNGGDGHDHDGFSVGQLLFGLWMWRELESGRLDAGSVFKTLFVIAAVLGGGFLLLLAVVGMSMPRYDGYDPWTPAPVVTYRPAILAPATARPTVTPRPTPEPTPEPAATPSPTPAAVGKADLRFSGAYAEHYVQPVYDPADLYDPEDLDGVDDPRFVSACRIEQVLGKPKPVLTGFHLESNARSKEQWSLNLDDLGSSWSMDLWFPEYADALGWFSGLDTGSVKRTSRGFSIDVRMADTDKTVRVRGTVTCR